MASEAGKGSGRRPTEVSQEVVASNWDRIFGKNKTIIGIDPGSPDGDFSVVIADQAGIETKTVSNAWSTPTGAKYG